MADVRPANETQIKGFDGTSTFDLLRTVIGDAQASTGILATALMGYNGSTYDRLRTGISSDGAASTGVLNAALMTYNGSAYNRHREPTGDGVAVTGIAAAGNVIYNASGGSWDRQRIVPAADGNTNSGLPQTASLLYNGTTWDRARSIDGLTTASATPNVGVPVSILTDRRFSSLSLGTTIGNTQSWDVNGAGEAMVFCGTSTTGTYIIEVSADGTNYINAEVFDTSVGLWMSNVNLTPTNLKVYRIRTNGYRTLRVRTVTTLGATVAFTATISQHINQVSAIDVGPAPHNIGYTFATKTAQYTTTQTGVALWTPASGKKICITSVQIQVGGTTAGTMQLWFGASGDTTYTRGTDAAIFDGEWAPSSTLKPGLAITGNWQSLTADYVLRVTDSAAINPLTVTVWGYEFV